MPIAKSNYSEVAGQLNVNVYASKKNPFYGEMIPLTMEEGQTYKFRLLPMNWEERFGETARFYHLVMHHGSIGANGQELTICPGRTELAVKVHTRCPLCDEFSKLGKAAPDRAKMKAYYYVNAILLSDNINPRSQKPIPKKKANGKFIVYTLRLSKTQVFDIIAQYYANQERNVKDIVDLVHGCAISVMVGKRAGFKNYQTQILEASKADVTPYIDIDDIKDLRNITAFVPTYHAVKLMMDNTSIIDAIEMGGRIDYFTGKQIGGGPAGTTPAASTPTEPPMDITPSQADMQMMDEGDLPDGISDFTGNAAFPASTTTVPGTTDIDDLSKL